MRWKLQCISDTAGEVTFSGFLPSQSTIYGHYVILFQAIVMDSAQLLSITERDEAQLKLLVTAVTL